MDEMSARKFRAVELIRFASVCVSLTHVRVLTCHSRWSRPSQVNGVLEFYSVFLSRYGAEPVLVYNSSELFEDYTLRNLTPGTGYTITVAVSPLPLKLSVLQFTLTLLYICLSVSRPAVEAGVP